MNLARKADKSQDVSDITHTLTIIAQLGAGKRFQRR